MAIAGASGQAGRRQGLDAPWPVNTWTVRWDYQPVRLIVFGPMVLVQEGKRTNNVDEDDSSESDSIQLGYDLSGRWFAHGEHVGINLRDVTGIYLSRPVKDIVSSFGWFALLLSFMAGMFWAVHSSIPQLPFPYLFLAFAPLLCCFIYICFFLDVTKGRCDTIVMAAPYGILRVRTTVQETQEMFAQLKSARPDVPIYEEEAPDDILQALGKGAVFRGASPSRYEGRFAYGDRQTNMVVTRGHVAWMSGTFEKTGGEDSDNIRPQTMETYTFDVREARNVQLAMVPPEECDVNPAPSRLAGYQDFGSQMSFVVKGVIGVFLLCPIGMLVCNWTFAMIVAGFFALLVIWGFLAFFLYMAQRYSKPREIVPGYVLSIELPGGFLVTRDVRADGLYRIAKYIHGHNNHCPWEIYVPKEALWRN